MATLRPRQPYERSLSPGANTSVNESVNQTNSSVSINHKHGKLSLPDDSASSMPPTSVRSQSKPVEAHTSRQQPRYKILPTLIKSRCTKAFASYKEQFGRLIAPYEERFKRLPAVRKVQGLIDHARQTFPGWQCNGLAAITAALVVLCINFGSMMATIGISKGRLDKNWVGTVSEGNCERVNRLNEVAHVFLNLLSTVSVTKLPFALFTDVSASGI